MKVKFKKLHKDAVVPSYAKPGDAGLDLTAASIVFDTHCNNIVYKTGIAVEIPAGYVGLVFPRSSVYKTVLSLTNSVGVIDSGFRGELTLRFIDNYSPEDSPADRYRKFSNEFYHVGDRIGQLVIVPYPQIELEEVEELSDTVRGDGGFGSSGA